VSGRRESADVTFACMGCEMRLLAEGRGARAAVEAARRSLQAMDRRLSRFRPDSELCALNRATQPRVPASRLLRAAVGAARWAAERSHGLVDPTLLDDLERAGYRRSMSGPAPAPPPLAEALASAPRRRPARARPQARWRDIVIDDRAELVARPPGLRLDTSGSTKGLAADLCAQLFPPGVRFVVDCGGDLRLGAGEDGRAFPVAVAHPLGAGPAATLPVATGAVATSGLGRRRWWAGEDGVAHHLLDPSTGAPAWTGLLSATATAPGALEAEVVAKSALLAGPVAARRLLARRGGVLVHDDGEVEVVGPAVLPLRRLARSDLLAGGLG
jgi:thiamine biosynthesis lipoprotein